MELLEKIINGENIADAIIKVMANKGAAGIDNMTTEQLDTVNFEEIKEQIRNLKYQPVPVRRVEIPKENGKMRKLGIPSVIDRVIQQAIVQVIKQ